MTADRTSAHGPHDHGGRPRGVDLTRFTVVHCIHCDRPLYLRDAFTVYETCQLCKYEILRLAACNQQCAAAWAKRTER